MSFLVHHEFGEVPFDEIAQGASLLAFQVVPKGMGIFAVDVDLTEEIEAFAKLYAVIFSKSLDFCVRTRFLAAKLVARECKNAQTVSFSILEKMNEKDKNQSKTT